MAPVVPPAPTPMVCHRFCWCFSRKAPTLKIEQRSHYVPVQSFNVQSPLDQSLTHDRYRSLTAVFSTFDRKSSAIDTARKRAGRREGGGVIWMPVEAAPGPVRANYSCLRQHTADAVICMRDGVERPVRDM